MEHFALEGGIANQTFVVAKDICLLLLFWHWAAWMIAMMYHTFVVAPKTRSHFTADVLPIRSHLNQ
jgi:hypothetical protein